MTDTLAPPDADAPPKSAPVVKPPRPRRRLHLAVKLLLLILYGALLLTTQSLRLLQLDAGLLLLASIACLLPPRLLLAPVIAALAAEAGLRVELVGVPEVALALSKVLCIAQVFAILSATTPVQDLLRLFSSGVFRLPGVNTLAYLLSMTLAALPSVQRDLRKSLDVAILRGGGRRALFSPSAWTTVVLDLLVRTVLRSQRLGDAVADRGFDLARGLTPLPGQRVNLLDVLLSIALAAPGIVVYRMML